MNNKIAVYGFTEEQLLLLIEHMPDGYIPGSGMQGAWSLHVGD